MLEGMSTKTAASLDSFANSNFNLHFLNKNAQKINNMIQSFVENDSNNVEKFNDTILKFNERHKDIEKNNTTKKFNFFIHKEKDNDSSNN